ncbi:D-alanyl-D-alanine carboxypeptidase family protein [Streptococcus ictaluri]|uniref:D-alanyl-D-alanine carboxypeptidase family protein n=1 Tax=Streptococcus ictaluri TaxID=380397 RepID=UPI001F39CEEB|nr:serine hydrolase [Streptococcus ictaluri]
MICYLLFHFWASTSIQADDIMDITRQVGYTVSDFYRPKASIVIDTKNAEILWQDNIDIPRDPASMSKMFTLFLLFQDLKAGKVSLDTTIKATETDQAISKIYEISNNNIVAGVDYPIRELITMTAVPSSNAATVMIANYLSKNDASAFIDRINQTAKKLGMKNTHFTNASGAAAQSFQGYYNPSKYDMTAGNTTTARDLAILLYHFLTKYPDILNYTKDSVVHTMVGTPYEEEFHSYNYSLPNDKYGMEGVDGLKTGSSPGAAFNAMVTAKRGETRLIAIIMGVGDWTDQTGEFYRHPFANALLEKGFEETKTLTAKQRKKLERLLPKLSSTSEKLPKKQQTKEKAPLTKHSDNFFQENRQLILVGLALFILIILILALIAFLMT